MVDLVYYKFTFFGILLLYYYINLRTSVIFSFFWRCLLLNISLSIPIFSASFVTVSELFYGEFIETFVKLLAILSPIKSTVGSAVF